jgi:hypothetical protein
MTKEGNVIYGTQLQRIKYLFLGSIQFIQVTCNKQFREELINPATVAQKVS